MKHGFLTFWNNHYPERLFVRFLMKLSSVRTMIAKLFVLMLFVSDGKTKQNNFIYFCMVNSKQFRRHSTDCTIRFSFAFHFSLFLFRPFPFSFFCFRFLFLFLFLFPFPFPFSPFHFPFPFSSSSSLTFSFSFQTPLSFSFPYSSGSSCYWHLGQCPTSKFWEKDETNMH